MDSGTDLSKAQAAAFPAARKLWRFVVSMTVHTIWVERLCRIEDLALLLKVHPKLSVAGRFEGFVDQHTSPIWRTGTYLRRYRRLWLIPFSATMNLLRCTYDLSSGAQEFCTSYFSTKDLEEIQVWAELDR